MSIEGVAALANVAADTATVSARAEFNSTSFENLVTDGLHAVNGKLLATERDLQQLSVGNIENLHQVMIHLAEAKESLQLVVQLQGRLMDAYQEVMRMQV